MSITMDDVREVVAVLHSGDRARLAHSLQNMINEYIGQEAKLEDLRARLNRHGAANNDARAALRKAEDEKVRLHQEIQDLETGHGDPALQQTNDMLRSKAEDQGYTITRLNSKMEGMTRTIKANDQRIDRLKAELSRLTDTVENRERAIDRLARFQGAKIADLYECINKLTAERDDKDQHLHAQRREIKELQARLRPNWVPYTGTDQPYAITFELPSRYFQTHPTSNGMMQDKCQEVLSRAFDMVKSFSSCLMQDNPEGFRIRCRPDQFAMFIYYRHKLGNCINGIRDLDPALDKLPGDTRLVDVTDRCIQVL